MNQRAMDKVFWTAFGVGGVALLALLLVVVNSDYSWEAVGELGVLGLQGGLGVATGVYITAQTDGERRWCLAVVVALLALAVGLLVGLLG
jgi:1,4-dihydroxy-2-naphthoate octaprenyltransferase